eukprot:6492301-Amphidinium_carterae.4
MRPLLSYTSDLGRQLNPGLSIRFSAGGSGGIRTLHQLEVLILMLEPGDWPRGVLRLSPNQFSVTITVYDTNWEVQRHSEQEEIKRGSWSPTVHTESMLNVFFDCHVRSVSRVLECGKEPAGPPHARRPQERLCKTAEAANTSFLVRSCMSWSGARSPPPCTRGCGTKPWSTTTAVVEMSLTSVSAA